MPRQIVRSGYTRKAHVRKSYKRADGTHVKSALVKKSKVLSTRVIDIGKRGKGKKVLPVLKKGELSSLGYKVDKSDKARHIALNKAVDEYGGLRVFRMLNAQAILRKHGKSRVSDRNVFFNDRDWVKDQYYNTNYW